jgi:aryl-alcohol dehydrogenase-like predicted oxidoreductase
MHELGGTVIDTARAYPGSEANIGRALKESNLRSSMFISTKFNAAGVVGGESPDIDRSAEKSGLETFEQSLHELQTAKVDLLMAHWLGSVDPLMAVMLDLKKAGRVRYIGITNFLPALQPQLAQYMRKYPLDFVQVDYRLNDRSAEKEIFPLARERRVAIMASVPFGGKSDLMFRQIGDRKLPGWAADFDAATWGQFFLKYVVSHPDVTCAIPGSNDIAHVEDNLAAGRGRMPDAAMRKKMEGFWEGRV